MLEKLAGIEARYEELNRLLAEVGEDYKTATEYAKERSDMEPDRNQEPGIPQFTQEIGGSQGTTRQR